MAERYVCIHGHFYQPPRENPWLDQIELQESAYPYHDWNERIAAECYTPNGRARRLDAKNQIVELANNYAAISFNFGPTLLSWLEQAEPRTYQYILEGDAQSRKRFSGHGNAIAQAYSHMILPLANARDQRTQVLWGLRDFASRFGRPAEGMWLPETAVNLATLNVLAECGVQFTILSPYQAARFRPLGASEWIDVNGGKIDPHRPYRVNLAHGRHIAIFFYDGPSSQAVAFEQLLDDAQRFTQRLLGGFDPDQPDAPQLVHIATDGESYGHHHRFGEMALAQAIRTIGEDRQVRLTNYAEFLSRIPPRHEAEIIENSSWSCPHGIGRWSDNCGCATRPESAGRQAWRKPLREALDWLRDELAAQYATQAGELLRDPWEARDEYIDVILDRSESTIVRFLEAHARQALSASQRVRVLQLLESQRHAMLMYTSCGWFFDELSRIETIQVLQYACRAAELARQSMGVDLEPGLLERLANAPSHFPDLPDGRQIYERFVKPAVFDLARVAAHAVIDSAHESEPRWTSPGPGHSVTASEIETLQADGRELRAGTLEVQSVSTGLTGRFAFAGFRHGQAKQSRLAPLESGAAPPIAPLRSAFERQDWDALTSRFEELYPHLCSVDDLSADRQHQRVLEHWTRCADHAADQTDALIAGQLNTLRSMPDAAQPPRYLRTAFELSSNLRLFDRLSRRPPEIHEARKILAALAEWPELSVYRQAVTQRISISLSDLSGAWLAEPASVVMMDSIRQLLQFSRQFALTPNLAPAQAAVFDIARKFPLGASGAPPHSDAASEWNEQFNRLSDELGFSRRPSSA